MHPGAEFTAGERGGERKDGKAWFRTRIPSSQCSTLLTHPLSHESHQIPTIPELDSKVLPCSEVKERVAYDSLFNIPDSGAKLPRFKPQLHHSLLHDTGTLIQPLYASDHHLQNGDNNPYLAGLLEGPKTTLRRSP